MTRIVEHCTLFNKNYLLEGLSLLDSFLSSDPEGNLWVLCLDEETFQVINSFQSKSIKPISLRDVTFLNESFHKFLKTRSFAESVFTIKSHFVCYVLSNLKEDDWLIYLDSDSVLTEDYKLRAVPKDGEHIILSPHYRSKLSAKGLASGEFNAGYVGFRVSDTGLKAANWWRDSCTRWCYVTAENNLYADQKYLENLHDIWANETFIAEFGLNLSTWSFDQNQEISRSRKTTYISNHPLFSFHFHSLRHAKLFTYLGINRYGRILSQKKIKKEIYYPYLRSLDKNRKEVKYRLSESVCIENLVLPPGVGIRMLIRGLLNGDVVFSRRRRSKDG